MKNAVTFKTKYIKHSNKEVWMLNWLVRRHVPIINQVRMSFNFRLYYQQSFYFRFLCDKNGRIMQRSLCAFHIFSSCWFTLAPLFNRRFKIATMLPWDTVRLDPVHWPRLISLRASADHPRFALDEIIERMWTRDTQCWFLDCSASASKSPSQSDSILVIWSIYD